MEDPSLTVTRLIKQACEQYPGGLRQVFSTIRELDGGQRAESTMYADFSEHPSSNGKLKVRDLMQAMSITGNHGALRFLAAHFGYHLTSLSSVEPDAPTIEAEMLQDYPSLVKFHESVHRYRAGDSSAEDVLAKLDAAMVDLRQTAAMALSSKK